jgi:hypothetical protein
MGVWEEFSYINYGFGKSDFEKISSVQKLA